jgi:hypothetical protein
VAASKARQRVGASSFLFNPATVFLPYRTMFQQQNLHSQIGGFAVNAL